MMTSSALRTLREFKKLLDDGKGHEREPSISEWSVKMHIHHCALAMELIFEQLQHSFPPIQNRKFSIPKIVVVWLGLFPRGKAKAPSATVPDESIESGVVVEMLEKSEQMLTCWTRLFHEGWMKHPYFGGLTRWESLRFLAVHNSHHLKIIKEIVASGHSR